tara:strand:+ start:7886 stop:9028 length:1143 start_codon:yes stop_codon:yes gene_type:complete
VTKKRTILELSSLFLKLGITAFGGPAAHIAMMRSEVVDRKGWLTDTEFLDLLAATHLIPGPNSTELAIHIGLKKGKLWGLLLSGLCFIVPAAVIVGTMAWAYVRYSQTPQLGWLMYGVSPIIIAIIVQAVLKLSKTALRNKFLLILGVSITGLSIAGINELLLLGAAAILVVSTRIKWSGFITGLLFALASTTLLSNTLITTVQTVPVTLTRLTLFFLKTGSILFGSGYVLLAFLRADLTERWGWLTEQELIDAVTIGQLTPGPVFTTATFIGYLLEGWPGAILATVGIFGPGFVFVALTQPVMSKLRESTIASGILDGLVVASLGLMAAVAWQLFLTTIVDIPTLALVITASLILIVWNPNSTWLILMGAVVGWLVQGG